MFLFLMVPPTAFYAANTDPSDGLLKCWNGCVSPWIFLGDWITPHGRFIIISIIIIIIIITVTIIVLFFGLGDWITPHGSESNGTSPENVLFNNCYYHYITELVSDAHLTPLRSATCITATPLTPI